MKSVFLNKIPIIVVGLILFVFCVPRLSADENSSETSDDIDMVVGDIQTVAVNGLTRVSVTDPDVADISDAESDKVSLLAKKSGSTVLFIWDAAGKRDVRIRVVSEDLTALKERIQKLLAEANISGVSLQENLDIGKLVATGNLSKEDKGRLSDLLGPYSDNLLNLITEEKNEDLIQVDMQIVEISLTVEKDLGINWSNNANGGISLTYPETLPTFSGNAFNNLFKVGTFARTTPLTATVDALLSSNKARLISKPRLVVLNGKQASFLVGGEIPVENTTTNTVGTSQSTSTTYAQYGVNVSVTPTIREGKIDVVLNVDIRDIDKSQSSSAGTAFITRTASTDLFMDNNQTVVLAGLIKVQDSLIKNQVPFLSQIPILGALFRETNNGGGDTRTEMVIILTPTVLTNKKFAEKELLMPTPSERQAWNETIESKYEHDRLPTWPVAKMTPINAPEELPVMEAYARMVQERISRAIAYPVDNTLSGTVKLKLHILKDGSLDSAEVMESSGNDILDQNAMQAAKTAAPYDAFTTGMDQEDMEFTIPIVFNKLVSSGQAPAGKVIASY